MPEQHTHNMNLEKATESTLAKAITRFGVPVLLSLLGFAGAYMLQDIRTSQTRQAELQIVQSREIQQVSSDLQVLKATVDSGLVWRITDIERRLNQVERSTKTP
jgi:hypothetical protein